MDKKKVTMGRGTVGQLAALVLVGAILLVLSLGYLPARDHHTGLVVLNTPEELGDFASSVLVNRIKSSEYSITGMEFPYVAHLDVLTGVNAPFYYGQVERAGFFDSVAEPGFLWNWLGFIVGAGLLLLVIICLAASALWPKFVDHRLKLRGEWVKDKKGEGEEVVASPPADAVPPVAD